MVCTPALVSEMALGSWSMPSWLCCCAGPLVWSSLPHVAYLPRFVCPQPLPAPSTTSASAVAAAANGPARKPRKRTGNLEELHHPLLGDEPTLQLLPDRSEVTGAQHSGCGWQEMLFPCGSSYCCSFVLLL